MRGSGVGATLLAAILLLPLAACSQEAVGGPVPGAQSPSASTPGGPDLRLGYRPRPRDFEAVEDLLRQRAEAVLTGDEAGFLAGVDDRDPAFVAAQREVFLNLRDLGAVQVYYGVERAAFPPDRVPGGGPRLRPEVVEHVLLPRADLLPVANKVRFTFVRRDGRWLLGAEQFPRSDGELGSTQSRPWAQGRIAVATRGDLTVVVDEEQADRLPALADAVRDELASVSEELFRPVDDRLLVDATSSGTPEDIGSVSGFGTEAAAVTRSVYAATETGYESLGVAGWRIKMNPEVAAELIDDRRVLRHELTHYVLRDVTVPLWLGEGLAEYVGWSPLRLDDLTVAAATRDRILAGASRDALPPSTGFMATPEVNYAVGFAAVTVLADRAGLGTVVSLADSYLGTVDEDQDGTLSAAEVDAATESLLSTLFGIDERALARATYRRLASLPR